MAHQSLVQSITQDFEPDKEYSMKEIASIMGMRNGTLWDHYDKKRLNGKKIHGKIYCKGSDCITFRNTYLARRASTIVRTHPIPNKLAEVQQKRQTSIKAVPSLTLPSMPFADSFPQGPTEAEYSPNGNSLSLMLSVVQQLSKQGQQRAEVLDLDVTRMQRLSPESIRLWRFWVRYLMKDGSQQEQLVRALYEMDTHALTLEIEGHEQRMQQEIEALHQRLHELEQMERSQKMRSVAYTIKFRLPLETTLEYRPDGLCLITYIPQEHPEWIVCAMGRNEQEAEITFRRTISSRIIALRARKDEIGSVEHFEREFLSVSI